MVRPARSTGILVGVENFGGTPVKVGTRIGSLILQSLDKTIETDGQKSSQGRANPVDPMVAIERVENHVRTKRTSGVEASAGEVNAWDV